MHREGREETAADRTLRLLLSPLLLYLSVIVELFVLCEYLLIWSLAAIYIARMKFRSQNSPICNTEAEMTEWEPKWPSGVQNDWIHINLYTYIQNTGIQIYTEFHAIGATRLARSHLPSTARLFRFVPFLYKAFYCSWQLSIANVPVPYCSLVLLQSLS